jgi:hypothetical protein
MKTWLARLLVLGVLGALVFWMEGLIFPSPERIIRQQLTGLAKAASVTPNEAPLVKLANTQKLSSFFTTDAEISVDVPGRSIQVVNGRDEILQAAMGMRSMLNNLKVEFVDIIVVLAADKTSAVAHLTATANMPGEKIPEVQELEIRFKKAERDWLINHVETVKTLR